MAGEIIYGSLGGQPIVSAATTLQSFSQQGYDYSAFLKRANSYTCRIGAEPGMAYVLMKQSAIRNLDTRTPLDLKLGIASKSITIKKLAFIQSQRLLPVASNDPDGLYLVTLSDVRWLLKRTFINRRYNLREYCTQSDWISGTLRECCGVLTPWTFAQIAEEIWGNFSDFGSFYSGFAAWSGSFISGSQPVDNPENLRFEGISALDALDQLCQQNGFYLRYDPLQAKLSIIKIGYRPDPSPGEDGWMQDGFGIASDSTKTPTSSFFSKVLGFTRRTQQDGLTEDTELFSGIPVVPEKLKIVFPTNGPGCSDIDSTNSNSARGWYYAETATAASAHSATLTGPEYDYLDSTTADTSVILYSTTYAQYASAGAALPSNTSALNSVISRMATDYYRTIGKNANGRVVYQGIKSIIPGPVVCEVIWCEWGDGLKTELSKQPLPVGVAKPQKAFSEGNIVTTTTTAAPSSTTTPAPVSVSACKGSCRFTWSAASKVWSIAEDGCSTTTSTTNTTSTTTGCPCSSTTTNTSTTTGIPVSSTSTSSTTSTSTTSTTPAPCACAYPNYCGTFDGECSSTSCTNFEVAEPVCGQSTTTTTCICPTTTSTTPPPCGDPCEWMVIKQYGSGGVDDKVAVPAGPPGSPGQTCVAPCSCEGPSEELIALASVCDILTTPCEPPEPATTTNPPYPPGGPTGPTSCRGQTNIGNSPQGRGWCVYQYLDAYDIYEEGWYLYFQNCETVNQIPPPCRTCKCIPPSIEGVCGDFTYTECGLTTGYCPDPIPPDPCYFVCNPTTTTSTTVAPCQGCKWQWSGTVWLGMINNCAPCSCVYPTSTGAFTCQTIWANCGDTTTTSTTSTSTTIPPTTTQTTTTSTSTSSTTSTTPPPCDCASFGMINCGTAVWDCYCAGPDGTECSWGSRGNCFGTGGCFDDTCPPQYACNEFSNGTSASGICCRSTTTTSTTTTTTTSTTPAPTTLGPCNTRTCTWTWNGFGWSAQILPNECGTGCVCNNAPVDDGVTPGQTTKMPCS